MDLMGLVVLVLVLALVGFLVWLILTYIPMPDLWKKLIVVVLVVFVVLYLIGLLTGHATILRLR